MAENGVKTYVLKINGVQESINAVDSLNKQLNDLEKRMNALNQKGVNVKTQGNSDLDAQEKLEKQILATEEKLAQVRDENYKKLLHMKEELKEYTQIAKSQVASEANQQGLYDTSTMAGMKAQLKSIKAEMQMVEVGGDRFQELTRQANELNNKLKEIEQSYGQFGRNVGNYSEGVAKGMQQIKLNINGVEREFANAREASRTLNNELKSMAVNGKRGTSEYKELQKALAEFNSTCKDATVSSQAMNNILHTMQGMVSVAQVGQGIGALFGFDDGEIQKSIQKLVGLQNVMMGIEKINQQINERVGIGKWLASVNGSVDKAVASLLKFNTALLGTGKAANVAAKGIKIFGSALKVAISAGILLILDELIEAFSKLVDYLKNGSKEMQNMADAMEAGTRVYAKAKIELEQLKTKLDNFKGSQKDEERIVKELNSKYGDTIGQYKNLAQWKQALIDKGDAYLEMLKKEAEMEVWLNKVVDAQVKLKENEWKQKNTLLGQFSKWLSDVTGWHPTTDKWRKEIEQGNAEMAKLSKEREELMKNYNIGDNAPHIDTGKTTTKKSVDWVKELYELQIEAMDEGLDKILAQLNEEKRQKLQKIQDDGVQVGKLSEAVNALYDKKIADAKEEWAAKIRKIYTDMWTSIFELNHKNAELEYENQVKEMGLEKDKLEEEAKNLIGDTYSIYENGDKDYTKKISQEFQTRLKARTEYYDKVEKARTDYENGEYEAYVTKSAENLNHELRTLKNGYAEQDKALKDHLKKGEITLAQYNEATQRLEQERVINEEAIKEKYRLADEAKEQEHQNNLKKIRQDSIEQSLDEYDEYYSRLEKMDTSSPILNGLGIVNIKASTNRNKEVLNEYETLLKNLYNEKEDLERNKGSLDPLDYESNEKRINESIEKIKAKQKEVMLSIQEFSQQLIQDINMWVQNSLSTFASILDSFAEMESNKYQARIDKQEEYIEKYQELLDKQKNVTQEYANEVNSIEDELQTARGARREHLIDLLNAQLAAQRASAAEEKRIEKEQEKAEQKKKKLEHDQAVFQKKMNLVQAIMNAAMAVSMAAVNKWPVPAIPMMAMASTVGTAQIALVASQKIPSYGDGGVIVGKSHKEGGVPVLGGRAEVEGNEFITNKKTTAQNTDLLYYINSKKRKLDLSDFIDFYSSNGAVRKNIQTVRTKFADGGQIPLLRNDIDVNSSIIQAMENYSNRPQVVQVVDIVNKMDSYRNTQVLAGLTPSF